MQGNALLQVFELDGAADFREDREGIRVPLAHDLANSDLLAVLDLEFGAVHHGITFLFTALVIDDGDDHSAIHYYQIAGLRFDRLLVDKTHRAVAAGFQARLLGHSGRRTADVEGTHGQLRAWLTNGLRRDHARGFTQLDHAA